MRIASPDGLLSWTFALRDTLNGDELAIVELKSLKTSGAVLVGGIEYRFKQTDALGKRIVLSFEGVELARATRRSVWTQKMRISFAEGGLPGSALRLIPLGVFQTGYRIQEEDGERIGRIERKGLMKRDLHVHLPDGMPLPLQGFLIALTMAQLRRQQSG